MPLSVFVQSARLSNGCLQCLDSPAYQKYVVKILRFKQCILSFLSKCIFKIISIFRENVFSFSSFFCISTANKSIKFKSHWNKFMHKIALLACRLHFVYEKEREKKKTCCNSNIAFYRETLQNKFINRNNINHRIPTSSLLCTIFVDLQKKRR